MLRQDLEYFVELFIELADAFVEKSLYLDALPIYERVMQSGKVQISYLSYCSLLKPPIGDEFSYGHEFGSMLSNSGEIL